MVRNSKLRKPSFRKQKAGTGTPLQKVGVVYLTQIPHGFYEREMRSYFSQFGQVRRLRVARSRKTLKSKGYAYIEFTSEEVSKIVAETMDNYLMFDKLIKSRFIPAEKVHPNIFFRSEKVTDLISTRKLAMKKVYKDQKVRKYKKTVYKIVKRVADTKRKLSDLGIKFEFDLDIPESLKELDQPIVKEDVENPKSLKELDQPIVEEDAESPEKKVVKKKSRKLKKGKSSPYLMEVHTSEDEVTFKTPPNTVKLSRRESAVSSLKKIKRKPSVLKNEITPVSRNTRGMKNKPVSVKIIKSKPQRKNNLKKKRFSV